MLLGSASNIRTLLNLSRMPCRKPCRLSILDRGVDPAFYPFYICVAVPQEIINFACLTTELSMDNIRSSPYPGTGAPASLPLSADTTTQDLSATGSYPQPYAPNIYHPVSTPAGNQISQPLSNSSQPSLIPYYPPPPRSTLQPPSAQHFNSQSAPVRYSLGQSPDPSRPVPPYPASNQVYSAPALVYQAVNQAYLTPNPPYLTPVQPQASPNQIYGVSNQAYQTNTQPYLPSSGHALDRPPAPHIYQSPSQPSSLPTQYVTYQQDIAQPVISQQNYNAPFLVPGEGTYTQVSPGSSKARKPSRVAALSDMIQSKAQGYLSKIQGAQTSKTADQSFQAQPQLYDHVSLSGAIQQLSYVSKFVFQTTETIQTIQQQHVASIQANSNQQNLVSMILGLRRSHLLICWPRLSRCLLHII